MIFTAEELAELSEYDRSVDDSTETYAEIKASERRDRDIIAIRKLFDGVDVGDIDEDVLIYQYREECARKRQKYYDRKSTAQKKQKKPHKHVSEMSQRERDRRRAYAREYARTKLKERMLNPENPNTKCTHCGRPMYLKPSKLEHSENHFCGKECYGKWKTENKRKTEKM